MPNIPIIFLIHFFFFFGVEMFILQINNNNNQSKRIHVTFGQVEFHMKFSEYMSFGADTFVLVVENTKLFKTTIRLSLYG